MVVPPLATRVVLVGGTGQGPKIVSGRAMKNVCDFRSKIIWPTSRCLICGLANIKICDQHQIVTCLVHEEIRLSGDNKRKQMPNRGVVTVPRSVLDVRVVQGDKHNFCLPPRRVVTVKRRGRRVVFVGRGRKRF